MNNCQCKFLNAAIDIGTNTIRLLVGCTKEGKIIRFLTDRAVTQLGKNVEKTGIISIENIEKSIKSLLKFKKICNKYSVNKISAVGTSILRDAKNSGEIISTIKEKVGIDVIVISGDEEAELTLKGVLSGLSVDILKDPILIVDVGGGSTEWIYLNKYIINKGSINIGSIRLYDTFIKNDPPTEFELDKLKKFIQIEISKAISFKDRIKTFIATGGTATSVAAIDMQLEQYDGEIIHEHNTSLESLRSIYFSIVKLSQSERSKIKGLEKERSNIIIPGVAILINIMERINSDSVMISDYGILEGVLKSL